MGVQIQYHLTQEGQKLSLLQGGNGRRCQKVDVPYGGDRRAVTLLERVLKLVQLDADGNATLEIQNKHTPKGCGFSSPKNVHFLVDFAEKVYGPKE